MPSSEDLTPASWFAFRRFALLLAAALGIFFWPVLFGGESFFYRDFGVLGYPTTFYFKHSILNGEIPFWNPYSNCGAPFLAQWGTMVLYPLHYLIVVLPLPWGLNFFCIFHLWLAGLGMHKLAYSLNSSPWAASVAGVVFVFNGITLSALTWPNYTVALAWMPWFIYFARKSWTTGVRNLVLACLAGTMQMMSGAPEIILLTWLALGAFGLADIVGKVSKPGLVIGKLALMAVLVAGLSAAQLLPFWELVQSSQRQLGVSSTKWSLPYWGWANFVLPMFHAFKTPQGTYFQEGQEFLASTYIGGGLLLIAFIALKNRNPLRISIALLMLFGALLALGPAGGVHNLIQLLIPGAGLIRYPVKAVYLVSFCVALLAGYFVADAEKAEGSRLPLFKKSAVALIIIFIGILAVARTFPLPYDRWSETLNNSIYRGIFSAAILALIFLRKEIKVNKIAVQFGLLLLIVLDAKTHLPNLNPTLPSSFMEPHIWETAHDLPPRWQKWGRIFITPAAEERLLHSNIADQKADWRGKRLACWSHLNLLELAPKVNGSSTLQLKEQSQVQTALYSTNLVSREAWLDYLDVEYISSPKSYAEWVERKVPSTKSLPSQIIFMEEAAILSQLPVLEPNKFIYLPSAYATNGITNLPNHVESHYNQHGPHELRLQSSTTQGGWISISQSWEKNWQAYVNGKKTELVRANHAFQAVQVPPGKNLALLQYEPQMFKIGSAISVASGVVLFGIFWRTRRVHINEQNQSEP